MEKNVCSLLIFLATNIFGSDTFWFSYRSVTSNKTLIYEEKNISPLTVPFEGDSAFTCRVKVESKDCNSKLECLNRNFYKILPCFYKVASKITAQSRVSLNNTKDDVELIIVPTRFIVDFKDDFAKITVLK